MRAFDPLLWRICVEAGVSTAEVRRLARENGLFFPPDPGAAEQSQIGGNIATNAGGPHAFKYGVTGAWVTGLEAVVPPGEIVAVGGPIRKDVAGYDLKGLLVGSEGTLGVITAAWLRLLPAPEAALPGGRLLRRHRGGLRAIEAVLGDGLPSAALEYLDGGALAAAGAAFPGAVPDGAGFMVIAEADGTEAEAERLQGELVEVLGHRRARRARARRSRREVEALWRWRDGVSIAVERPARREGERGHRRPARPAARRRSRRRSRSAAGTAWRPAAGATPATGTCTRPSWSPPTTAGELERAGSAAEELFELAVRLGGSVSGEHGVGWVKRGQLARQWPPRALELHEAVKRAFDPKGLMNPGKKIAS